MQRASSNFLLFDTNPHQTSCPASPFLYFYSTHMFLFKASSTGYHDWCAPPPPSQLAVQRPSPSSSGGRPSLSTTLLIFHRETSPFFHSFARQASPPTASNSRLSPFSLTERLSPIELHWGYGYPVDARCSPCRHSIIPPVVHHAFAAARRLAQLYGQLGQCSQGMSTPSDWSGVSWWQLTGHTAVTT